MYWLLFKLLLALMVPWPVDASLTRPDPTKNSWVFTCREWKSPFRMIKEKTA